jgi:hypothetical protein
VIAKLTWTEIKLGLREPTVAIFALAFPLILLYLLLNSFGTLPDPDFGGVSPADDYVPAYAAGSIAATGLIAIPVHLAAYRERGVLRRLRASGIAAWPVLAAQTLVAALIVTVGSAVMVALGDASYELTTPASWPVVPPASPWPPTPSPWRTRSTSSRAAGGPGPGTPPAWPCRWGCWWPPPRSPCGGYGTRAAPHRDHAHRIAARSSSGRLWALDPGSPSMGLPGAKDRDRWHR